MISTIETRWFFTQTPIELLEWCEKNQIQNEDCRTDWYGFPCNIRCGIKIRENQQKVALETKLLVNVPGIQNFKYAIGKVEEWNKWSVTMYEAPSKHQLNYSGWISVKKERRLYKCPNSGAQFELTRLEANSQTWWTVCFELPGTHSNLQSNLKLLVDQIIDKMPLSYSLQENNSYSYPEWLYRIGRIYWLGEG